MQHAVEDYNRDTKDLEKDSDAKGMQAKSMEDIQGYIKTHTSNFKNYRHPGGIADRLATAVGNHLGIIQAMSNALGAATTQFFPAAAPVFTAINFLIFTDLAFVSNKDTESALDVWNIRPNVSLASAYIACKQHSEAVKVLDPAFQLCMEWLTDDVVENDSSSLRLLARLLACAGLERDASIICSAQSSVISKDTPEPVAEPDPETNDAKISSESKDSASAPAVVDDLIPIEALDGAIHMHDAANTVPEESTEKEPEDATLDRLIPKDKEDIRWRTPCCNGCLKNFPYWVKDEPFYMCLTCYNMDLCKECHAKRVALDTESTGGETTKLTFCGENHDYVTAPVDDWGGIKDEILSIGHERFEFTHWLGDVKEKWEDWKEGSKVVGN